MRSNAQPLARDYILATTGTRLGFLFPDLPECVIRPLNPVVKKLDIQSLPEIKKSNAFGLKVMLLGS